MARPPLTRQLTEAEEYARSVREEGESIQLRHSRRRSGLSETRPTVGLESPHLLKRHSSEIRVPNKSTGVYTSTAKTIETRRQIRTFHSHRMSPSPEISGSHALGTINSTVQSLAYPPAFPKFLDGMHHTDELATYFEAGWPTIEKWLIALGGGQGNGDYGRVAIIYR